MREIVLDCETTGTSHKSGDRVISLGMVELEYGRPTGREFHNYFNPLRNSNPAAYDIHRIPDHFLLRKPEFHERADRIIEWLGDDCPLIAHNAMFDIGFLNSEFARLKMNFSYSIAEERVIDTLKMARQRWAKERNNLDAVMRRLGISDEGRKRHDALDDARILADVYWQLRTDKQSWLDVRQPEPPVIPADAPPISYTAPDHSGLIDEARFFDLVRDLGKNAIWRDYVKVPRNVKAKSKA